jgi:selenocysteine lyase/cysteine desulfurase
VTDSRARDVVADQRPGVGIRVSPRFYSTFEELDRLFEQIERVARS